MNERARVKLGDELQALLEMDEHSASAEDRGRVQRDLCSALEYLLQSLMDGQTGWDARYSYSDGILPQSIRRISPDAIALNGRAVVVHGKDYNLRPVQADLRLRDVSTIRFASPSAEFPYVDPQAQRRPHRSAQRRERSTQRRDRSAASASWPYIFDVHLGAKP
jgi:hypothetical protein